MTSETVLSFARRAIGFLAAVEPGEESDLALEPLAGDGSTRRIYRARLDGVTAVVVHNPPPEARPHPDENEGFLAVREFLDLRGVRVPAFYVADLDQGLLLLEDLGDVRLFDRVRREGWAGVDALRPLYEDAIGSLVRMQRPASPRFEPGWAANPAYDEEFIVAAEARYFHEEMVRGLAGFDEEFAAVEPECRALAREALSGPAKTFLHRDFQSRNLMLAGRALAVIDFQGARLGPPEYDLAALLHDPYVAMPGSLRESLIAHYLQAASDAGVPGLPTRPSPAWLGRFHANAANRLMQALGAFAKLGGRMGRPGFLEHIGQGLASLEEILEASGESPRLRELTARLRRTPLAG